MKKGIKGLHAFECYLKEDVLYYIEDDDYMEEIRLLYNLIIGD